MTSRARSSFIRGSIDISNILAFIFGVVFLTVMLVFAALYPNPEPFQLRVYVTALALSAGGVGAVLPGQFNIRYKNFIRASGALGLVVLVYMNQPALERNARFVAPNTPPDPAASNYLIAIDNGNVSAAWRQLDPAAQGFTFASLEQLQQVYETYRKPLGTVTKRELVGNASLESPPGVPAGLYRSLNYRTKFSNASNCRAESVTLRATQDITWRVFSHEISPTAIDC